MKILTALFAFLLSFSPNPVVKKTNPVIILISASSTPEYIGEMRDYLEIYDFVLNVEKELWTDYNELQEFAFTLTHKKLKEHMSFHFKFHALNKHQIFMIYPQSDSMYGSIMTDIEYLQSDLLELLVNMDIRKEKPIVHKSFDESGTPYREAVLIKDLDRLKEELAESIALYKKIKADQAIGASYSGFAYTYNGEIMENPKGIDLLDMSADVLIEELENDIKIINIWSDKELNKMVTSSSVAGGQ